MEVDVRLRCLGLKSTASEIDELLSQAARERWTHEEFLSRMLSREMESRAEKLKAMLKRPSHFPQIKTLEGSCLSFNPNIDPGW